MKLAESLVRYGVLPVPAPQWIGVDWAKADLQVEPGLASRLYLSTDRSYVMPIDPARWQLVDVSLVRNP